LKYNIRCKYTAYIADRTTPVSSVEAAAPSFKVAVASSLGSMALLRWSIANASEAIEVQIQRSDRIDGQFVTLLSMSPRDSEYIDADPQSVRMFYRIMIITRSGDRILSGVLSPSMASLPASTILFQNFPNPANPATTIRYAIAGAGVVPVRLAVYDLTGREIRVLVDARQSPGLYEVTWDGTSASRVPVASGLYFYRLVAGKFVSVRTSVLLR
jgi:hypothetical protein